MFLLSSLLILLWTKTQGLQVSPDRSVFFRWETVELQCDEPDWILLRITRLDSGTRCGQHWGEPRPLRCFIRYMDPMDSGWYWCESGEGKIKGSRNITVLDQFGPPTTSPPRTMSGALFSTETLSPSAELSPPSQRPLAVAVLCRLLVLCPYVVSTVLMLSLCRHTRSGPRFSEKKERRVMMMSAETAIGLEERTDDITVVTTEHHF
uniref:Ig-like domain-containing protein n=1 Tax=Knipowitschia caucasica TaxID=637954 RepID=A0AAV2J184_KNICA